MFIWMAVLTGILYPLLITGVSQLMLVAKSRGSLVVSNDKVIGSTLIGQKFEGETYFWGRPSAIDYNPLPSGGSNLSPTSLKLKKTVEDRRAALVKVHGEGKEVPSELLFASGSGLDPHISPKAAYYQTERVAKARKLNNDQVNKLVEAHTEQPFMFFMGESTVNVLHLNQALENIR